MKKTILIILFLFSTLNAQDSLQHKLKEVVVTSLHQPTLLLNTSKSIEVIGIKKISTAPINSVLDYLNYSNSVELNQRGTNGVQSDIGIRGGSFEQTLIMLDGIKIIDPQTGHHNLNLPVTQLNIEQIEVVKGNSSNINGANAFSGLINFRTKRNKYNSLSLLAEGGDFGLYSGSLFGSYNVGNLSNNFSMGKNHSDGYRENTEYDITNFSYGGSYTAYKSIFDVFIGYTEKSFGANSFYTLKFPLQYEETSTTFAKASVMFGNNNLNFISKIYMRKNNDEFLLDKTNPSFYKNNHTTNIYGGEINLFTKSKIGKTSIGGEYVYDEIISNSLGIHSRNRIGLFFDHSFPKLNKLNFNISGYFYHYSTIGVKMWPGFSVGYMPSNNINIFANYSRGFRIPTYTELYYSSPTTIGNSNLKHEETVNYEIGIKYFSPHIKITSSLFYKNATNIIDWVLPGLDARWIAMNIASINTFGLETNITIDVKHYAKFNFINSLKISYTYLNSDYNNEYSTSRYLLKYLIHQGIFTINHILPWEINANWYFRYEKRVNSESDFITDLSISKSFTKITLFAKATNLFNVNYYDFIGIPLPGRWISGGIKLQVN